MRMKKVVHKKDGYITVYLALTTGILISLILAVAEGIRVHTIRTQTECVMDMAADSALAEYHRELLEQYDLFFIDLSYGMGTPSFANAEEHIRNYMNMNFQPIEFMEVPIGKDLTALRAESTELLAASAAPDDGAVVLRRQAVDYVKNRWGITYLNQAAVNAELIGRKGFWESDVETRWQETEREVKEKVLNKQQQEPEDWEGQNTQLPTDVAEASGREGILGMAMENPGKLSRTRIDTERLLSQRIGIMEGTGLPQGKGEPSGISGTCLFQKYIMEKCGYYGKEKEHSAFSYQVEYILEGKNTDQDNLRAVANRILLVREASNAAFLFRDGGKRGEAQNTAVLLTSVLGLPELTEPMTDLILFVWAYAESVKDLRMLFDGKRVPLVKTGENWNTPYSQLLTFGSHLSEYSTGEEGMDYADYLEALLYLRSAKENAVRLMDVMEADIRLTPGNSGFRMDGCIDAMTVQADVRSGYGYTCQITRSFRYD